MKTGRIYLPDGRYWRVRVYATYTELRGPGDRDAVAWCTYAPCIDALGTIGLCEKNLAWDTLAHECTHAALFTLGADDVNTPHLVEHEPLAALTGYLTGRLAEWLFESRFA